MIVISLEVYSKMKPTILLLLIVQMISTTADIEIVMEIYKNNSNTLEQVTSVD